MKGEKFHYVGKDAGLVQLNAASPLDGLPYTKQVAGPDVGAPIGKTVFDAAIDGCDAEPMQRKPDGTYVQKSRPCASSLVYNGKDGLWMTEEGLAQLD